MIKPNILTHVIGDFVIQESKDPFPVTRQRYADPETSDQPPSKLIYARKNYTKKLIHCTLTEKRINLDTVSNGSDNGDMEACENCGKMEPKAKLKKKPFCSAVCAKTAKTSPEEPQPSSTVTDVKIEEAKTNGMANEKKQESGSTAAGAAAEPVVMVDKWTVSEVCEFIRSLHRCSDYADDFENQEIDGQALLLLTANNLVNVMGIKLGPALKIIDSVNKLKPVQQD